MAQSKKKDEASEMQWLTILEAAKYMGLTPPYIRTLIRKGKLKTKRVPIAEGAAVTKHVISAEDLDKFRTSQTRRTKRADGRNKYIFYATPDEASAVIAALAAADLAVIAGFVKTANPLKPQGGNHGPIQ